MTADGPFHGGDLGDVAGPDGAADWLDLSTGINPAPYPVPALPDGAWTRLPGKNELDGLIKAAAACYGAPDPDCVVAGPGSQALIQALPSLFPPGRVAVLAPTYGEHVPAWNAAGHNVREILALKEAGPDETVVLVNPNNPDGRCRQPSRLLADAKARGGAGGFTVVDEAFADAAPELSVAPHCADYPVTALRSFGKFFGLAGLRLGFAIAPHEIAEKLRARLGPWAVSGPAISIASRALNDHGWQTSTRLWLAEQMRELLALLERNGIDVAGGTDLFVLAETARAPALFDHLCGHCIYVRRFPEHPTWLRFGLPPDGAGFARLGAALATFRD